MTGFQASNDKLIQVYDIDGGSFYSNGSFFNKEEFERQGFKMLEYKELRIAGFPAKYVALEKDAATHCQTIIFGDSTFATTVFAIFPAADKKLDEQLRETLLTAKYDKSFKVNPFATASFSLDDGKSKFKFAKFTANTFIYSLGGVKKQTYGDEPVVTIVSVPAEMPKQLDATFNHSLEKYGLIDEKVKSVSEEKVNGYAAYESETYGTMKGEKVLIYRLSATEGDFSVVIQAIAKLDLENNAEEAKKLARTIHFK